MTRKRRNWGFGLCSLYLRNVKGVKWNHKRIYRIERALVLNMRIKPCKRLVREQPDPLAVPYAPFTLHPVLEPETPLVKQGGVLAWFKNIM